MPRSRPTSSPLSFHKATGQHYVTRAGRRIYLGADPHAALERYHRLALGIETTPQVHVVPTMTAKEIANRFISTQQANWRAVDTTVRCYRNWLGRFLEDHPGLLAANFTMEMFAAWKLSLRSRSCSPKSINHYLGAVRALFKFGEEAGLLARAPRLSRVRNEPKFVCGAKEKLLYDRGQLRKLLDRAEPQVKCMLLLALNCGFGPKDIEDLCWEHVHGDRITLPRSKTGVSQTYALWPETTQALADLTRQRQKLVQRLARRGRERSDAGHVFVTKYWRPWNKDAVAEQFRKLCKRAGVPCYGFYRLRHCASTAMALVAMPHVHRKFLRHKQLQQQVTYTHTPDDEVDAAVMRARERLLGSVTPGSESGPERAEAAAPGEGAPPGHAGRGASGTRSRRPA
jgi:integrase